MHVAALLSLPWLLGASGCGGGGGSAREGAVPDSGADLALRALWQQDLVSQAATSTGPVPDATFDTPIPAAVETVRIIFRSTAGTTAPDEIAACCTAVDAAAARADPSLRNVVLGSLPAGSGTVRISGFLSPTAPSDGIGVACVGPSGSMIGASCSSAPAQTSPSYDSEPIDVTIRSGQRSDAGDIEIPAVPFIVEGTLMPSNGILADITGPVTFAFTMADAVSDIADVTLSIDGSPASIPSPPVACADQDPQVPSCTGLDVPGVRGRVVEVTAPPLSDDAAVVITGRNGEGRVGTFAYTLATLPCSIQQQAGGDLPNPDERGIALGQPSGTFDFQYETFTIRDRIELVYEGEVIFDSTCIGTEGEVTVTLSYAGTSSVLTVRVFPDCDGDTGTAWNYTVLCPTGGGSVAPTPVPTPVAPPPTSAATTTPAPIPTPPGPVGSSAEACQDDCQVAQEVCGDALFFDEYTSVGDCTDQCVAIVDDFAGDAQDPGACTDAQVRFIECCTDRRQCGEIPNCIPEFDAAVSACDGSHGGCPLIFF
jgi:hypothetical protein